MNKRFLITFPAVLFILAGCCGPQDSASDMENENPVIDAIMARRSIRYYTDARVEREKLQKIAECGINAPNAMNKQEWEVRIVDSSEYFDSVTVLMKEAMPFFVKDDDPKFRNGFRNATAAIFIACPDDESGMSLLNLGLMSENICLAAYSLGLGTCVMGGPAAFMNSCEAAVPYLERLQFSEGYKLRLVIALGYPDEQPQAKPRDPEKIRFID